METGWVIHFSNRFLGQKLLGRERLVSWTIVMEENSIAGPKFKHSTHSFTHSFQHFLIISSVVCLAL
jgi:hypothetical protein